MAKLFAQDCDLQSKFVDEVQETGRSKWQWVFKKNTAFD